VGLDAPASAPLPPGAHVGPYVLLEVLGEGGMGTVYKAYDPRLARPVALKMLRARRGDANEQERLLREAQALALLSHPNVVGVFDVGTIEGSVYVAMELVEGRNLRRWLAEGARARREIVQVLTQAGAGLAAAHRAGLVHRDFKPDNVMVGVDERVRVLDFGLARAQDDRSPPSAPQSGGEGRSPLSTGAPLTLAGAVLGTPAYMAPEQRTGGAASPRSDQYAFGVTLHEALYGAFPPRHAERVLPAARSARVGRVPATVRKVIQRALARRDADRYESMDALLAELRHDPAAALGRWLALAVLVLLAGVALVGYRQWANSRINACKSGAERVAAVWNESVKRAVGASFASTALPYADAAFARVEAALDAYAEAWARMHRDACEATHVRREQSGELLDLRMACLTRELGQTSALVELFAHANRDVVERAAAAVPQPKTLFPCADAAALRSVRTEPTTPEARRKAGAVRETLARARALYLGGQYQEAHHLAAQAVEASADVESPALRAEALALVGVVLARGQSVKDAERHQREAITAAVRARDDRLVAETWTDLGYTLGELESRFGEAEDAFQLADATFSRLVATDTNVAALYRYRSLVLGRAGDFDASLKWARAALEIHERLGELDTVDYAEAVEVNANALRQKGDYDAALATYERVIALRERLLGPRHPRVALAYMNRGVACQSPKQRREAIAAYEHALDIWHSTLGDEHHLVGLTYLNMAADRLVLGEVERSVADARKAIAVLRKTVGERHSFTASAHEGLAEALLAAHQPAAALAEAERALAIDEELAGLETSEAATAMAFVGAAQVELGRTREGLATLERALAMATRALGPHHPELLPLLVAEGEAELRAGGFSKARGVFEEGIAIAEASPLTPPSQSARVHIGLARALLATDGDAARARPLVRAAQRVLAESDAPADRDRAPALTPFLEGRGGL
jgi:tetratricopeptide (TPR) repeat protein/predicted Ser/Thr protein kinase